MKNKRKEEKMEKEEKRYVATGFPELLTLVFIVLKLCHVITWSWLWVLSPLWIGAILAAVIIAIELIILKKVSHE